jgi:hypothetical protein
MQERIEIEGTATEVLFGGCFGRGQEGKGNRILLAKRVLPCEMVVSF